ncbi:MAG: class I SAM-dependent methyltransferase, partial [Myxococcales bacterium]|nr:class I SAM-dependent methyltransferase [Myxococcales bacterium]
MSQSLLLHNSTANPLSAPNRALQRHSEERSARPGALAAFAKRLLLGRLVRLEVGSVVLMDGQQAHAFGTLHPDFPEPVRVSVRSPQAYVDLCFGGSIGAAEAYARGHWTCAEPATLARIFARNRGALWQLDSGLAQLTKPAARLAHALQRNTLSGSRRNIEAHYDLGNDFYSQFLDETLSYSAAVFESPDQALFDASVNKLERVCRKLDLKPTDHLVEIGSGWGALAVHAAEHFGCRVTTTTLSREQYRLARQRVAQAGMDDRIEVLLRDYRDLPLLVESQGRFDKLVSIEMVEAVGHQYLSDYFQVCERLLKPDGLMLIQAITIRDQRFEAHKHNVDFIKRYIFPGSCIPSLTALSEACSRTDLKLIGLEDISSHYALTLRHWRERFMARRGEIAALGYGEEFLRLWEWYLAYCEGAF